MRIVPEKHPVPPLLSKATPMGICNGAMGACLAAGPLNDVYPRNLALRDPAAKNRGCTLLEPSLNRRVNALPPNG